jgi:glycosyltransferase involved in cell wall biosynthesis
VVDAFPAENENETGAPAESGAPATSSGDVLVDIGIPSHGRPRFLTEAIECVLAQKLQRWRLTVQEDGPGGGDVARAVEPYLSDPRIRFVTTGEPVGAARNMSGLLALAEAPYVALLHDDDLWGPEFLARRVAFLEAHPECGFVFAPELEINADGERLGYGKPHMPAGVYQPQELVPRLLWGNLVSPTTLLTRRSSYEAVGPAFDTQFPTIYDYEMVMRLSIRFPAGYLGPHYDSSWRRHSGQSTTRNYNRSAEYVRFIEHVDSMLQRDWPELRLTPWQRRRRLGQWLRFQALNAAVAGDRRSSLSQLGQALRTYPPTVLAPGAAVSLLSVPLGSRGLRAVRATRARAQQMRLQSRR